MKRKQVLTFLLAVSMAAANVATAAPIEAFAKAYAASDVSGVTVGGDGKVITVSDAAAAGKTVYISDKDVDGDGTVAVKADGTTYEKALINDGAPADKDAFNSAADTVTLNADTFSGGKISVDVYFLPKDAADISGMIKVTVAIDSTAPVLTALTIGATSANIESSAGSDTDITTQTPVLNIAATEAESGVTFSYAVGSTQLAATEEAMGGQTFTAHTSGEAITLSEGDNYIYVKMEDGVGHVSYACSKKVTVDSVAPAITSFTVDSKTDKIITKEASLSIAVTTDDTGATITYAVGTAEKDASALASETINQSVTDGSASVTLAEGTNYIYIKVADAKGNASYACSQEIVYDKTAPTLQTLTVGGNDATGAVTVGKAPQALVIAAAADATNVTISYATSAEAKTASDLKADAEGSKTITYTPYTAGTTLSLSGATNFVFVKLEDEAGNVTYVPSGAITVDDADVGPWGFSLAGNGSNPLRTFKYEVTEESRTGTVTGASLEVAFTPASGDEVNAVRINGNAPADESDMKTNKKLTLTKAGKYEIEVEMMHTSNHVKKVKTITVECYETVAVTKQDVTKTFGEAIAAADFRSAISAGYAGTVTTRYKATGADDSAYADGLPENAGSYDVEVTYPADEAHYYLALAEKQVSTLTINQKSDEPAKTYNETVVIQGSDTTTTKTVDLASIVADYASEGDTLSYTVGAVTGNGSGSVDASNSGNGSEITIKGAGAVTGDKDATVPVTVTGFKNYSSITVNIPVKITEKAVVDVEILGATDKVYDGTAETVSFLVGGAETASDAAGMTVTGLTSEVKNAGTYTITVKYDDGSQTGYASKTITVSKKPVTMTLADTTVVAGTAADQVTYPSYTASELAAGESVTYSGTISSGYTAETAAGTELTYTGTTDSASGFTIQDADQADTTANYEITVSNGKVKVVAQQTGGSGDNTGTGDSSSSTDTGSSSDSSSTGSGSAGGGAAGGGATDGGATETTTVTPVISTNDEGESVIVDQNGAAMTDQTVKVDGAKYITDEKGVVVKDSFATTAKGNKVYAGEDGKIITNKTFKVDGKKYIASKSGAVQTKEFVDTASGNTVYCTKDGSIVTNKTFTVDGNKYIAKKSGAIVKSAFATTPGGSKVYCGKDGVIAAGKVFKVDGKQYVAKNSGALVIGKWVTVGNKKYYCDKNGVVTKTKSVKKTSKKK